MRLQSFEAVVGALNDAGVRYLIAGGLAVNAHGYLRFTHDVDLVIELIPDNVESAFQAFATLGYHPDNIDDIDWSMTTWEGNRRAQLRRSLELSLRERLQAIDEMAKLAQALWRARAEGRLRSPQ